MYTHVTVNHTHYKHHSGEWNIIPAPYQDGARSGAVDGATALKAGRSQARFPMVSFEFFFHIIVLAALWPCGDSASNRNDYREYFLGDKSGQCVGLKTLPIVLNLGASTSWNPQSLSRPVQGLLYNVKMLIKEYHTSFSVKCMTKAVFWLIGEKSFVDASSCYILSKCSYQVLTIYIYFSGNKQYRLWIKDIKTFLL